MFLLFILMKNWNQRIIPLSSTLESFLKKKKIKWNIHNDSQNLINYGELHLTDFVSHPRLEILRDKHRHPGKNPVIRAKILRATRNQCSRAFTLQTSHPRKFASRREDGFFPVSRVSRHQGTGSNKSIGEKRVHELGREFR